MVKTCTCCSGGLEALFGNKKEFDVDIPAQNSTVLCDSKVCTPTLLRSSDVEQCEDTTYKPLALSSKSPQLTVADVLVYSRDKLLVERPDLFIKGQSVYVL